jgi:AAA+ superfamily predicted ATPase
MPFGCVTYLPAIIRRHSDMHAIFKVVNAVLTQLDKLKHRKNALVLTTSNLSQAIGTTLHFWRSASLTVYR